MSEDRRREEHGPSCPLPARSGERVGLAHGGGGARTRELIDRIFGPAFANEALDTDQDAALLTIGGARLAFTTDSYVVSPLFFPGGNIGSLAVNGTVNDLAMRGARPLHLSCGFILEEGLELAALDQIARSMRRAADRAGVSLVTGDTKVVERGKGDGVYLNTAGVGTVAGGVDLGPARVRAGDAVLVSGDVGRHGMAILGERESLAFESDIESDCAPLAEPVLALLEEGVELHCLRDLTRGGLATAACEIARAAASSISLEESSIPIAPAVAAACEILGLDPLYVANEGRFCAFVAERHADRALEVLRQLDVSAGARRIGRVGAPDARGRVTMRTPFGAERILELLSGEQLPRIC